MKRLLFILTLVLLPMLGYGQQVTKAKATLTLNFIRYIGWTDDARQGDFVIGVIRDKELANHLRTMSSGKKFGFQDVVIKEFKSVDEVEDCQVIYASSSSNYSKNAQQIMTKVGKGTLIISEQEGAANHGAMINFVVRDEKLKFELSKKNAAFAGIQFNSKLENMTTAINL